MKANSEQRIASSQQERRASDAVRPSLTRLLLLFAIPYSLPPLHSLAPLSAAEPQRPIRETLTLPVDSQVSKTLLSVDEYLADKRYAELTELLINLVEAHGHDVIPVTGSNPRNVRRYLNVATHCQGILAALPPDGRAASRQILDPQARRWYDAWQTTHDESHLERIIRSAYVSSYGDNALWELGEAAWDRGDFSLASAYWSQLLPPSEKPDPDVLHYPDAEFDPALVEARLILCDLFSQHSTDAERKLLDFQERHATATGDLAGRTGKLNEILLDMVTKSRDWEHGQEQRELTTFGGSVERQQWWREKLDVGPLHWTAQWPTRKLPQVGAASPLERGPLRSSPVIDGDRVFVCDGDVIRGWNVLTGQPAWPNDQPDPSVIYPQAIEDQAALPDRPCVGVPWQTLTIHRGKLYARMGSPVVGAARTELRDLANELVCLDIADGQGKLVWKLDSEDIPSSGAPWSFEGTPVVVDDMAFAAVYRRQPETEFALLAIDAASGAVQWLRPIGSARPVLEDAVNRVSHLLLTAGQGRLYLSTDQGAIVCLSPLNGRLLWALSYDSQLQEIRGGVSWHLQSGLLPPLFWRGLLIVAPNDTQQLFCLDAASGRIIWQRKSPERLRHLIGVTQSSTRKRLIASGNSLWAFDVETGDPGWHILQSEPSRQGYGHGLLTGKSLFWPSREWLYQVDPASGDLQREIALHPPESPRSGGNLAVSRGVLVIVEPDRICVYGEYSLLKERLKIDLSQRPNDPTLWQEMMELEAGAQDWNAAIAAGRRAWTLSVSLPPAAATALRGRWTSVLRQHVRKKTKQGELPAFELIHFAESAHLSISAAEHAKLLWEWSQIDARCDRISEAAERLHEVLLIQETEPLEIDQRPAAQVVREQLEELLRQHGREPFRKIDQRGETELLAALSAGDSPLARQVLLRYPLLESAPRTWSRLVDDRIARQNWSQVWRLIAEWQSVAETDEQRRTILEKKAAALATAGYSNSAARLDAELSTDAEADSPKIGPTRGYVVKHWELNLAETSGIFVPEGMPPDDSLACVLVTDTDLHALDRNTGAERWRQPVDGPVRWAAYGETDLLLATNETLTCRDLETGEPIWRRTFPKWDWASNPDAAPVRLSRERLLVFQPGRGILALSPVTGESFWEFRPSRGKLQSCWASESNRVIAQTLEPPELWIVDTKTGQVLQSGPGTAGVWRYPPVSWDENLFAFVTRGSEVFGWGARLEFRWKYRGAMSHAHVHPWLFHEADRIGLLVDGTTLIGLEPETGRRLWGTGFADDPLIDPARQVAVMNGLAIAASDKRIRAVALKDGRVAWEHALPADGKWRVQRDQHVLIASTPTTAPSGEAQLILLHGVDGQFLELLRHPGSAEGNWHADNLGVLWTSPRQLAAWSPLSERTVRQTARNIPRGLGEIRANPTSQ